MRDPVHTATWSCRPTGAPTVDVGIQESLAGSYRPPVSKRSVPSPPHTIIWVPVHTALWKDRGAGAFTVVVAVHVSETGSYEAPVFDATPVDPPHTIIRDPVQTD